jgi:uncharacterized membrane protein YkvA (DUF1232 family)
MEKEVNPLLEKNDDKPEKKPNKVKLIIAIVLAGLALVYDISPVDLIPDILPVVGWVDDIIISALAFTNLIKQLKGK